MRYRILAAVMAVATLAASCLSGKQLFALHSQRIAAEERIAMRPSFKAAEARDVEVYDQRAGIGEIPNQLKEWLDFGTRMGWICVSAFGIYELSDKIGSGSKHTTNNYNNQPAEVAP